MEFNELLKHSREIEQSLGKEFEEINHFIFENPELGMKEYISSKYLVDYLKQKGFEVEYPYAGMETAFRASYGKGKPTIALLAEYDALPGYYEDKRNAHACGHNWISSTTVGTAVVLKELTKHRDFQVVLIGTPAEETYCSKVAMVEQKLFDDIDVVIQSHLSPVSSVCPCALAMNAFQFEFRGRASHSSGAPWDGINALDAVQLTFAGINALRQHVKPDARIHGIITNGGQAANIVPDKASCLLYVRAQTRAYVNELIEKVHNVAKGAAMMTGASLEIISPELPMDNLVHVPILQEIADKHLRMNGIEATETIEEARERAGSTDIGNVSHVCPTMYMEIGLDSPEPMLPHEVSALDLVDSRYAYDRLHQCVCAMAGIALELVEYPEKLEQTKKQWKEQMQSVKK